MVEIIMPQMGESIFEATITRWLKKIGDVVAKDEPLFEISTDKIDTEIPSPSAGRITKILVAEGQKVPVKTVVAEILVGEEAPVVAPPAPQVSAPPAAPVAVPAAKEGAYTMRITPQEVPTIAAGRAAPASLAPDRVLSSPLVRKMAREHGIDLVALKGSGWKNRITKKDIESVIETRQRGMPPVLPPSPAPSHVHAAPTAPAPAPVPIARGARDEVVPMSTMRAKIAEHMVMSRRTSAHVTTVFEVDMTAVDEIRRAEKEAYERVYGTKLTFTHFFAMAAVRAIGRHPILNCSVDGHQIVMHHDINLGIAVSVPDGLIVPVVKHAEELSFLGLARAVNEMGRRARDKKLTLDDIQGGTFTITNPGVYGGLFGTPIISQPQVAIMGIGTVEKRPVIRHDAIAIRSMCYLDLSFDHRVIDGAAADQFMADVKKVLETWDIPVK